MLTGFTRSHLESTWNPPFAPSSKCWRRKGKHHHPHHVGIPGLAAQAKHTYQAIEAWEVQGLAPSCICSIVQLSGLLPINPICNQIKNCLRCYILFTHHQSPSQETHPQARVVRLPILDFEVLNNRKLHLSYIFRNKTHTQLQLFPTSRNREFLHYQPGVNANFVESSMLPSFDAPCVCLMLQNYQFETRMSSVLKYAKKPFM